MLRLVYPLPCGNVEVENVILLYSELFSQSFWETEVYILLRKHFCREGLGKEADIYFGQDCRNNGDSETETGEVGENCGDQGSVMLEKFKDRCKRREIKKYFEGENFM